MVDPLSYFQPVLQNWCNKGHAMRYPVCGMVHINDPLLLIEKLTHVIVTPVGTRNSGSTMRNRSDDPLHHEHVICENNFYIQLIIKCS